MKNLQVLVATMNQTDFSLAEKMNLYCDAVFANQTDQNTFAEKETSRGTWKMISTNTRGVGKNRNFALALASGEILLFADDDLQYEPDFVETVNKAFQKFSDAEMILFGTKYSKNGKIFRCRLPETGRLLFFKALRYGTCAIAIRRNSVLKNNLHFSELFGGGCRYSYGEDTDFIVQCFRKRLKIYSYHAIIATTSKDTSTCYTGYGEKFFFDKGALARHSLGLMSFPYMFHMARKKMESELRFPERLKYLWAGYRCFHELISYEQWAAGKDEKNHYCE